MIARILWMAAGLCCLASGQAAVSVRQLSDFLKSSVQMKQADKDVAGALRGLKLSERLDDGTFQQLQQGLGPKTLAVLRSLKEASASLKPPAPAAPPPPPAEAIAPPAAAELARIVAEARENSLNYSNNLPNYMLAGDAPFFQSARRRGWVESIQLMPRSSAA